MAFKNIPVLKDGAALDLGIINDLMGNDRFLKDQLLDVLFRTYSGPTLKLSSGQRFRIQMGIHKLPSFKGEHTTGRINFPVPSAGGTTPVVVAIPSGAKLSSCVLTEVKPKGFKCKVYPRVSSKVSGSIFWIALTLV